jgi:phosphate transport system protein
MSDKHLSSQFDSDLNRLSTSVLEMGGLVECQVGHVLDLMTAYDPDVVSEVLVGERRLNAMELAIDEALSNVIARRQPAARDLRLLMALSKCVTNLERAGDEARKIAKRMRRIREGGEARMIDTGALMRSTEMALVILHKALDAFARMDTVAAAHIVRDDEHIDAEFRTFVRKLVPKMMEDPRSIATGLEYLFVAKAVERIGDHSTNIAEFVVYVVKGRDVRHIPRDELERAALS